MESYCEGGLSASLSIVSVITLLGFSHLHPENCPLGFFGCFYFVCLFVVVGLGWGFFWGVCVGV